MPAEPTANADGPDQLSQIRASAEKLIGLRKGEGLTISGLRKQGSDLLHIPLIDQVVAESATDETRARALYGAIYILTRAGVGSADRSYRRNHVALACAFNISIADDPSSWQGVETEWFPDLNSASKRRSAAANLNVGLGYDRKDQEGYELQGWRAVLKRLTEFHGTAPEELREGLRLARLSGERYSLDIPAVDDAFFGRSDQIKIAISSLTEGRPVLVTGPAGIGKSQLAVQVAASLRRDGLARIQFLACSSQRVETQYVAFGRHLGATSSTASIDEQIEQTRLHLASTEIPWMLVFDDLIDPALFRRLAPVGSRSGRILVTSQIPSIIGNADRIELDVLESQHSVSVLEFLSRRSADPDGPKLAEALGHYPLALHQAGVYCSTNVSFAEYLSRLENQPLYELTEDRALYQETYERTVFQTWMLSMRAAAEIAESAGDIFYASAYLDGTYIAKTFIEPLQEVGEKSLRALARYSLVQIQEDHYTVHSLLQRIGRSFSAAIEPHNRIYGQYALAAFAGPSVNLDAADPANWPTFRETIDHAISWGSTFEPDLFGNSDKASRRAFFGLMERYIAYLSASDAGDRGRACARIVEVVDRWMGPESPEYAQTLLKACAIGWTDISLDVVAEAERAIAILQRAETTTTDQMVDANLVLLTMLVSRGRMREAYQLVSRLVADGSSLDDGQAKVNVLTGMADISEALGKYDQAQDFRNRAIHLTRQHAGHPDKSVRRIESSLASLRSNQLKQIDIESARSKYDVAISTFGEEHEETLYAGVTLALGLAAEGSPGSGALMKRIATVALSKYPTYDLRVLGTQVHLARVLVDDSVDQACLLLSWAVRQAFDVAGLEQQFLWSALRLYGQILTDFSTEYDQQSEAIVFDVRDRARMELDIDDSKLLEIELIANVCRLRKGEEVDVVVSDMEAATLGFVDGGGDATSQVHADALEMISANGLPGRGRR